MDNSQLGFLGNTVKPSSTKFKIQHFRTIRHTNQTRIKLVNGALSSGVTVLRLLGKCCLDLCSIFLLVSDRDKNLYVYMYLPEGMYAKCSTAESAVQSFSRAFCCLHIAKESFGGMRLLRRADFNAGANINTFWRMPCRGAVEPGSRKAMTWDNKHITWFGTQDALFC